MKPWIHAENSAKKWGGTPTDYLKIHDWFDYTKSHFADNRHRALRHHTLGIFEAERVFGATIINSDKKVVSVRDIGEQHVLEDLGFIPTVADYLNHLLYQDWMGSTDKKDRPKINDIPVDNVILDKLYDGYKSKAPFKSPTLID